MRQNLPWPIAVDCSVFPASGTACGSCWGSVLWVRCRAGARQCRLHAMLGGLWGDLSGSLCHSTAPWALLQVLEEKPSGLLVASLQAKDPDEGENGTIIYSLIGTSSRTGKISAALPCSHHPGRRVPTARDPHTAFPFLRTLPCPPSSTLLPTVFPSLCRSLGRAFHSACGYRRAADSHSSAPD